MRWYLTYYSEGLHRYCYILNKCTTQVSVNLIEGLSSSALSQLTKCVVVLKMRYGQQGALLLWLKKRAPDLLPSLDLQVSFTLHAD